MQPSVHALLVEDNPGDAKLVEHYLGDPSVGAFLGDIETTHVESLTEASEAVDHRQYDVILLDLGLPESDGVETLERAAALAAGVPIIVLTGLESTDVAVEAIQSGAQDYLPKGDLDGDRLVRSLRYAIERHKQEQALTRKNEQLDFFNSVLRHDMLNGLNIIMARASTLQDELDDHDQVSRAEDIHDWSTKIADLGGKIGTILGSVTDSSDRSLEPTRLEPVVRTEADRVRSLSDRVDVDVTVPEDLSVMANDLFDDVVGNVLTNAVEHTEAATQIEVTARDDGTTAVLRIADDGAGIPSDRRDEVFERGQKGAASAGTGFGLFFVSSMVESYGGSVRAEESEHGGTAFVLELSQA